VDRGNLFFTLLRSTDASDISIEQQR